MPRVMPPNWKTDAVATFLRGELNRGHFEKLVENGLMFRQEGQKSTPRRGRNPIEYGLTEAGWKFAGQTPRDVVVSTESADKAADQQAEPAPKPTPKPAPAVVPKAAPVVAVKTSEPVPRLTPEELAAIEDKPRITREERSAYFANVNWNVNFDRPETAGYDSEMPAFLDRRHPAWKATERR